MTFKDFVPWYRRGSKPVPVITNQDIANDLLIQIGHKAGKDQREIVYYLLRKIAPGQHIHSNPKRKVAA